MKAFFAVALLLGTMVFSGCDTLEDASSSVREKFSGRDQSRSKTFTSPPRVVFEAVKLAASNMGYRQTRGGAAQGEFEAVSSVAPGESAGTARQITMKVRLHGGLDGNSTDVSVRLGEILETGSGSGRGMGTETAMKDTPLYEVFFRNVQLALDTRPVAAPVK